MNQPTNHYAAFFALVDGMRLTDSEREKLKDVFRAAMHGHGMAELYRGLAAGRDEAARREQRTREEIAHELLDRVQAALGLDE